jgi:PadR family transcriptional regulator, regulatory protein PadR
MSQPGPGAATSEREATTDIGFDGSLPRFYLRSALHVALLPGPSHGYDLLLQIRALGLASVDLGGVYRTLRAMERERTVNSDWEASGLGPPRRVYELTDDGLEVAVRHLDALRRSRDLLDRLIDASGMA